MITGRKLLLADDSLAIQKVIDLTFTDEGMEVTTVGDGQDALEQLNQSTPDVVLADVYMPGLDGFELCKYIKQSERFRGIPVMLLIGTFEPFDEAEARRAGADDVVTKPFQSIRQLVSRVGSLLSDHGSQAREPADKYSMLGLNTEESTQDSTLTTQTPESEALAPEIAAIAEPAESDPQPADEHANVRVFVEASVMPEPDVIAEEHTCPSDIELQTADTKQLEPIEDVLNGSAERTDVETTIEVEVLPPTEVEENPPAPENSRVESESNVAPLEEEMNYPPMSRDAAASFDDAVLDLGDVDSFVSEPPADEFFLDLDVETISVESKLERIFDEPPVHVDPIAAEPIIEAEASEVVAEASMEYAHERERSPGEGNAATRGVEAPAAGPVGHAANLSPEVIEAISRRVVEQLSDKVVREIAWEVVPELSELLIKKRLEEEK